MGRHGSKKKKLPRDVSVRESSAVEDRPGHWTARSWSVGHVRTIEADFGEILVLLFAGPGGPANEELHRQLTTRLERVKQTPPGVPGPRHIPQALRLGVASMLEFKVELETQAGMDLLGVLVLHHSDSAPALAHIGGEAPQIRAPDQEVHPYCLSLQGPNGTRARTLCLRPGRLSSLELTWTTEPDANARSVGVDAEWDNPRVVDSEGDSGHARSTPASRPHEGSRTTAPAGEPSAWTRLFGQSIAGAAAPSPRTSEPTGSPTVVAEPAGVETEASARAEVAVLSAPRTEVTVLVPPTPEVAVLKTPDPKVPALEQPVVRPTRPEAAVVPAPQVAPTIPVAQAPVAPTHASPPLSTTTVHLEVTPATQSPELPAAELVDFEKPRRDVAPKLARWPRARRSRRTGLRAIRHHVDNLWAAGPWLVLAAALLAFGWFIGGGQSQPVSARTERPRFSAALHAVGLAAPEYHCLVNSVPDGASITIDGKPTGRVTPATLRLKAGEHQVELALGEWGSKKLKVSGGRDERVTLEAQLWGSISVRPPEGDVPVTVSVDGTPHGRAPTTIDQVAPGVHDIKFSSPGEAPTGQTVEVRVDETSEVSVQTFSAPRTGQVEVRAIQIDGSSLEGARVRVDGQLRGTTPLVLELPRGRHSIRASYRDAESPVQVIDLPGGNRRFIRFEFGSDFDRPRLTLLSEPEGSSSNGISTISAELTGVNKSELSEMWLLVSTPEKPWRRYEMTPMVAPGGLVGVAVFPTDFRSGRASYYVSAMTTRGDEYFTEIRSVDAP